MDMAPGISPHPAGTPYMPPATMPSGATACAVRPAHRVPRRRLDQPAPHAADVSERGDARGPGAGRPAALADRPAANRSESVVGLSNLFAVTDVDRVWAGAIATISARFAGLAIVGYEHGSDLDAARRAGLSTVGPLRVWLKD